MKKMSKMAKHTLFSVIFCTLSIILFLTSSFSSYAASASVTVGSASSANTSGQYEIKINLSDVSLSSGKTIDIALEYNNIAFSVVKTSFSSSVKNYASAGNTGDNPYHITIKATSGTLKPSGTVCTVYFKPQGVLAVADFNINATISGVSANVTSGVIRVTCSHSFSTDSTVASSCTTGGYTIERCSKCGEYRQTQQKEPLGHDYKHVKTVEPDCTQHGYTIEECTRCHLPNTIEGEPPLGHEFGIGKSTVVPPTCAQQGYTEYACLREGCEYTERTDYTDTVPHVEGDTVLVAPTCQKQGSENVYCEYCGIILGEKILDIVPHDFEDTIVEPTCTSPGYTHRECKSCHIVRRENSVNMIEHSYTSVVEKEAGCTSEGRIKYICSCGDSYTEKIPELGHNNVKESVIDATDESEGLVTYVCDRCGYTTPQILPIGSGASDLDSKADDLLDAQNTNIPRKLSGRETLLLYISFIITCAAALAAAAILVKKTIVKIVLNKRK